MEDKIMFQNIDELEKQVKEFQQNILASEEFVKGIQNLTEMVRTQQSEFDTSSKEMLISVETYTKHIKEQTDAKAKEVIESNSSFIKEFECRFIEYEKSLELLFDKVRADNMKVTEDTISAFKSINQDYAHKIDAESVLLKQLLSQLEIKYNEFIQKLENTNVDRFFAELQDLKKTINSKFTLLFAGVGMAIVLMIISFLVK